MQCACSVLYWRLWWVWFCYIFYTLSHKRHVFGGGGNNSGQCIMRVLIFCTTFIWNISYSKKNLFRYYRKCAKVFFGEVPFIAVVIWWDIPVPEYLSSYYLPSAPGSSKWFLSHRFSHQNSVHISPVSHTCHVPFHFIFLDLTNRNIFI